MGGRQLEDLGLLPGDLFLLVVVAPPGPGDHPAQVDRHGGPGALPLLALAPVAIQIDENLRYLRSRTPDELAGAFELVLDAPASDRSRAACEKRVLDAAVRGVDLHGWDAALTEDGAGIRLSGGSVSLDVSTGAVLVHYLESATA